MNSFPTFWGTPIRLAAFGSFATKAIKRCCLPDLLGIVIHQSVDLLLQPVKPIKEHLSISTYFGTSHVFTSYFLACPIEQNAKTLKLGKFLFHDKAQNSNDPREDHIPNNHFHISSSMLVGTC